MGSVGNPNNNPWPPYDTTTSCSQGICTLYCPQFCYFFFPPPPTSGRGRVDDPDNPFSPLVIAVIVLLSTALVFAMYYTITTKCCTRRSTGPTDNDDDARIVQESHDQVGFDQWQGAPRGLDEATIKKIAVCEYRREDAALIDGNKCAVCLSEFQEGESLRLLPKCRHPFHLPCIDTWLRSHSSCPLCRASVVASVVVHAPPVDDAAGGSQPLDEVIVTVEGDRDGTGEREGQQEEGLKGLRRSVSLGACSSWKRQGSILDEDVVKLDQNCLLQVENKGKGKDQIGSSSSKGFETLQRCFSTGSRLKFAVEEDDQGKNSLFLR